METFKVNPRYADQTDQLLEVLRNFEQVGEYVVKGERNLLKKVQVEDFDLVIKKFKTPMVLQGLVYQFLRKSKAQRSFEYAQKLSAKLVKTPYPVAYYERKTFGLKESYYISAYLNNDFDFRVLNHNPLWPNRDEILKQFAEFTFKLHEHGIRFLDHSPGNTLIRDEGSGRYSFWLIDLNRMRFGPMNFNARMKNFRRMWLSKTMINIMAPVYADLYGKSEAEVHQRMTYYSRKFQRKINAKKLRRRRLA